jgi:hypothetical protein
MWPSVKSCCGANGQCKTKKSQERQSSRECKQIAFEHQKSIDLHADLPVIAAHRLDFLPRIAEPFTRPSCLPRIEPSPPDLQALHSTFLI